MFCRHSVDGGIWRPKSGPQKQRIHTKIHIRLCRIYPVVIFLSRLCISCLHLFSLPFYRGYMRATVKATHESVTRTCWIITGVPPARSTSNNTGGLTDGNQRDFLASLSPQHNNIFTHFNFFNYLT